MAKKKRASKRMRSLCIDSRGIMMRFSVIKPGYYIREVGNNERLPVGMGRRREHVIGDVSGQPRKEASTASPRVFMFAERPLYDCRGKAYGGDPDSPLLPIYRLLRA